MKELPAKLLVKSSESSARGDESSSRKLSTEQLAVQGGEGREGGSFVGEGREGGSFGGGGRGSGGCKGAWLREFEELFDRYYSSLCAFAAKYFDEVGAAEDVVSSLFVDLWESRERVATISNMANYLTRATHNRCLNKIRENESRRLRESAYSSEIIAQENHSSSDSVESKIDKEQIIKIINGVEESLPERAREIYNLREKESLSYKEIAERLNISVGTVKTQMHRVNKRIREALKHYTFTFFI